MADIYMNGGPHRRWGEKMSKGEDEKPYRRPSREEQFGRAIEAIDKRDADALCWELLRTTLSQLDHRGKCALPDGVVSQVVSTLTSKGRRATAADADPGQLREWLDAVEKQVGGKKHL